MSLLSRHRLTQKEFQQLDDAVYDPCGLNLHQASNRKASSQSLRVESTYD
jgi:hypothetical protein